MNRTLRVAITGASGFLGNNLIAECLRQTDWVLTGISRHDRKVISDSDQDRFRSKTGDVTDYNSIRPLLEGIDVAYYFVHMMGHKHVDFYKAELAAARTFSEAARDAGVRRIIYMGGLGIDDKIQSLHLSSRHRTGDILRQSGVQVIELRASMIIGRGSVAFDIIDSLVRKLPIMPLPGVAETLTQPIALTDALTYLKLAAILPGKDDQTVQIGGPEVLSYEALYRAYARWLGKRRLLFRVPLLPAWVEGKFLDLFTPTVHSRIGKVMVESMANEMIVTDETARKVFPDVKLHSLEDAFRIAQTA